MTSHRIEITFVGDAPESELERAKILGDAEVGAAISKLQQVLGELGLKSAVSAHTVRTMPKKARAVHGRHFVAVDPQAAE